MKSMSKAMLAKREMAHTAQVPPCPCAHKWSVPVLRRAEYPGSTPCAREMAPTAQVPPCLGRSAGRLGRQL